MHSRFSLGAVTDNVDRSGDERFHAVRVPLLSRELAVLALLLIAGGAIIGISMDANSPVLAAKQRIGGHDRLIESVVYSPDGHTLISCGWDNTVRLWNVDADHPEWGREVARLPQSSHLFTVALTPDASHLAIGGTQGFSIWGKSSGGEWENLLEETGQSHRCIVASPDNRIFAVGGADGAIRFWDVASLRQTSVLPAFSDEVRTVAFSDDGSLFLASAYDGTIRAWRWNGGKAPEALPIDCGPASYFALSPSGTTLATAHGEGIFSVIKIWDLPSGRERVRLKGSDLGNNVMVFSPDGRTLACADKDNIVRLRHPETGEVLASLDKDMGWVKTLAFSPDGRQLAFGGRDGGIRFREVPEEVLRPTPSR